MQTINEVLLVSGQAFNVDGYAAAGVGNPACLSVLPGKANNKRAKAKPLNETFDIDF